VSFIITVYVPGAIVMASDSRQFITVEGVKSDGTPLPKLETVGSDFVYKTFLLKKQHVGISTFGESILDRVSVQSHINKFHEEELEDTDDIFTVPQKLLLYFRGIFQKADTGFHIAGFRKEGKTSVPYVFYCHIGRNEIVRRNSNPKLHDLIFGATWSGQIDVISSVVLPAFDNKGVQLPKPPIIWDAMTVQDAIQFAIYAVRITIDTMRYQARPKNVGGAIDVLLLTPDNEPQWIQRKKYEGS